MKGLLGIGLLARVLAVVSAVPAAPKFSDWSAPTNLGSVNSAFRDGGLAISMD